MANAGFEHSGEVTLLGSGSSVRLGVKAVYIAKDPYAVRFYFQWASDEWVMGRDLLFEAVENGSAGVGDVKIRGEKEGFVMTLSSPDGTADILFDDDYFELLVDNLKTLVPVGTESDFYVDMEQEFATWMSNG